MRAFPLAPDFGLYEGKPVLNTLKLLRFPPVLLYIGAQDSGVSRIWMKTIENNNVKN